MSTPNTPVNIDAAYDSYQSVKAEMNRVVVADSLELDAIIGAVAQGSSVLFDGDPGIGKSLTAESLAAAIGGSYSRIQGNADTTPADMTGSLVFKPEAELLDLIRRLPEGASLDPEDYFRFVAGPLFANLVLVDEINRMPPKSQSGLIEAMQNKQVTPSGSTVTYGLPKPFIVLATQNHKEDGQGTFDLPKAGIDRFDISIHYPDTAERKAKILARDEQKFLEGEHEVQQQATLDDVANWGNVLRRVELPPMLQNNIVNIGETVLRHPEFEDLILPSETQLSGGRANAKIARFARWFAFADGKRMNVNEEDIAQAARFVLPHRIAVSYDAIDEGKTSKDVVEKALAIAA